MTTYSIREFKARASEILRNLDEGDEVIITRHGKPCGKLTSMQSAAVSRPSLSTLRGTLTRLPEAEYQDFLDAKAVWERGDLKSIRAWDESAGQ